MVYRGRRLTSDAALVKLSQHDERHKLVAPETSPPSAVWLVRILRQHPESGAQVDNRGGAGWRVRIALNDVIRKEDLPAVPFRK